MIYDDYTIRDMAYEESMNGFGQTTGDAQGPGHFSFLDWQDEPKQATGDRTIYGVIIREDNEGFKHFTLFTNPDEMVKEWDWVQEMVSTFYDDETEVEYCPIHKASHTPGGFACEVKSGESWAGS